MRDDRRLGDKLGPRLVDLVVQATIAARKGTAPTEARIQQAALQGVIDRAGHEVAGLWRPFITPLAEHEKTPKHVADFLRSTASGEHQWQAITGARMLAGTAAGALSTIINNELAPAVYEIVRTNPNLDLDPNTTANAVAAGIITMGEGISTGRDQGYAPGVFQTLVELATAVPDLATLGDMVNRGLLSEANAKAWLRRAAISPTLHDGLIATRKTLLSPADLALSVLRGTMSESEGRRLAALTGTDPANFDVLIQNTGEPLGLMQLLEAFRRGFIDKATLERGIRQSRVRDEWIPAAVALRYTPMATADAIDALLKGHITEERAKQITDQNGLEPGDFAPLYASAGEPLALMQLLEAYRRGYIDDSRLAYGIRQGRLRDEWIPVAKQLRYAPMGTADAIEALLRGHIDEQRARTITAQNGLQPSDFDALYASSGDPLSLTELWEAWRRGYIDESRFEAGLRQGRLRDDWISTAKQLRYSPISVADAIEAAVQNQITITRAKTITQQNGLDPVDFEALYNTAGSPLSRTEMEALFNRGLVTQAQVEQALRESRLKDKYVPLATQLHVRLPEPRLVVDMVTHGVIDWDAAMTLLQDYGYTSTVACQLIQYGESTSTGKFKELAAGQVLKLYEDKIITDDAATKMLRHLHYSKESAAFLLQLTDLAFQQRLTTQALTAIRKAYLAFRLDEAHARHEMIALAVPVAAQDQYISTWDVERRTEVRVLTAAQVVKAYTKNMFDPQNADNNRLIACGRLCNMGYDEVDAGLLLDGA